MNISSTEFAILKAKQALKLKLKSESSIPDDACKLERDLHEQTTAELRRRKLYFVHSRMDKPATNQIGVPDYIVAMPGGKTMWLELKSKTGKLSPEQQAAKHMLEMSGHRHEVVRGFSQLLEVLDK